MAARSQIPRRLFAVLVPQGGEPAAATVSGPPIRSGPASLVTGDDRLHKELLPDLIANYEAWEKTHRDANGLFWQIDDRDGMEVSIGGSGYRATINTYMYGDALAIAQIAEARPARTVAERVPRQGGGDQAADAGETMGCRGTVLQGAARAARTEARPMFANCTVTRRGTSTCPTPTSPIAWKQVMDPQGFYAPSGRRRPSSGIRSSRSPTRPRMPVERPKLAVCDGDHA